jgi:hypothetical protein
VSGESISATLPCDWSLWYSGKVNAINACLKDAAEKMLAAQKMFGAFLCKLFKPAKVPPL